MTAERAGFRQALPAEWTKLVSVRSAWAALAVLIGLTIAMTVFACSFLDTDGGPGGDSDIVMLSLGGLYFGQLAVALLGALMVTSEYATGTIRTTFTANPRRVTVLSAKAVVLSVVVLAAGALTTVGSFLAGQHELTGNGFTSVNGYPPASLDDPATFRAVLGSAVYLVLLALMSLGIGTLVRKTAAAITITITQLYAPVLLMAAVPGRLSELIQSCAPLFAGVAIQSTVPGSSSTLTGAPVLISAATGLTVIGGYALTALLAGGLALKSRDA